MPVWIVWSRTESWVESEEVPDLRLTGALISLHWASLFHRPLSRPGHKNGAWQRASGLAPHWAHSSEWVQAPSWELSNRIESFNTSTIPHTLYLPVEFKHKWWFVHVYLLLGLMSSFCKVCMKISCSEQRCLYKQTVKTLQFLDCLDLLQVCNIARFCFDVDMWFLSTNGWGL